MPDGFHSSVPQRPRLRRFSVLRFPKGTAPGQHKLTKTIDESRSQVIVPYEEAHINRSVERIEKQVKVNIFSQFTALNSTL